MYLRFLVPFALASVAPLSLGCSRSDAPTGSTPAAKAARVVVDAMGFSPATVHIAKGEKSALVFERMTDETCAKAVDFPELGVRRDLPLRRPVTVEIPTGEARTLIFRCGMGMYKSSVVIH